MVGLGFIMIVADNGEVLASGNNFNGYLGVGVMTAQINPPAKVIGDVLGRTIIRVKGSGSHTLAMDNTGKVFSWGNNGSGQLSLNFFFLFFLI